MIEFNKNAQTVAEFLNVPTDRINELSIRYEGKNIFEILGDALENPEYSVNERLAIWFQVAFNFGQHVLIAETQKEVNAMHEGFKVH